MPGTVFNKLAVVCLLSSKAPPSAALMAAVSTAQAIGLVARQAEVCGGDDDLNQCGSGLPDSFCCPEDTECLPVDRGRTVICCPSGQNCTFLRPVTCDISQQNATRFPSKLVHTTELDADLARCGSSCCPGGYSCQSGMCALRRETSRPISSTTSRASSTESPTSTSTLLSSPSSLAPDSTNTSSSESAVSSSSSDDGDDFPATAVIVGIVSGVAFCVLLAALIFYLRRRRKRLADKNSRSPSTITSLDPNVRNVSEPMSHPMFGARTEFLRRPNDELVQTYGTPEAHSYKSTGESPGSVSTGGVREQNHPYTSTTGTPPPTNAAVSHLPPEPMSPSHMVDRSYNSPYYDSPIPQPLNTRNPSPMPQRILFPRTPSPHQSLGRQSHRDSSETIDVLMQPHTAGLTMPPIPGNEDRRVTGQTTFADFMNGPNTMQTGRF